MIEYLRFGLAEGDWCNDFLTPPHMSEWAGRIIANLVGCWGYESMGLLVVLVFGIVLYIHRKDFSWKIA